MLLRAWFCVTDLFAKVRIIYEIGKYASSMKAIGAIGATGTIIIGAMKVMGAMGVMESVS